MTINNYDSTCDKLLPCPFCGNTPVWHLSGNEYSHIKKIIVQCPNCRIQRIDAGIKYSIEELEKIAINNWNKRI